MEVDRVGQTIVLSPARLSGTLCRSCSEVRRLAASGGNVELINTFSSYFLNRLLVDRQCLPALTLVLFPIKISIKSHVCG